MPNDPIHVFIVCDINNQQRQMVMGKTMQLCRTAGMTCQKTAQFVLKLELPFHLVVYATYLLMDEDGVERMPGPVLDYRKRGAARPRLCIMADEFDDDLDGYLTAWKS